MKKLVYLLFIFFSSLPILKAVEINLDESGITEYYPSCKKSDNPICIENIEIDKDKKIFIHIYVNLDTLPNTSLDGKKEKMSFSVDSADIFLALFNSRAQKKNGGEYNVLPLNISGYKADDIVILQRSVSGTTSYPGFAAINENEEKKVSVTDENILPIDHYNEQMMKYKKRNKAKEAILGKKIRIN